MNASRLVSLGMLLIVSATAPAQNDNKPLIWGADPDGGVPYVFLDPKNNDKYMGVEVDIADALSRQMKRPIVFRNRKFENLISDVERGDIDFAMNGIEIVPAHMNLVRFTKPYYLYQLQLVVRADAKTETLDEMKEKGLAVGTLGATAAAKLLGERGVTTEIYEDQEGPYKDLSIGRRVSGVLLDLPAALYYAAPDGHLKHSRQIPGLRFVGAPFAEGFYGIAVHKDNPQLQADLNAAIDALVESGELKRILQKWELWNADQYRLATPPTIEASNERMTFGMYFPLLLEGAAMTVAITLASMALAVLLGLPISLCRLYGPRPVRWLAIVYVEFFRGIPVLLLLYFLYYGLASLSPHLQMGPLTAAILGFGLTYAAYEAEIYRAGFLSIPKGQWEAAASLGMPAPLTFRRIILPQAIRVILPPMTNDLVALFKDTSVVSIIAVVELSKTYQMLTKSGGGYLQIGLATAGLYLMMSVPLGYLSRYLEHRWGIK
ncbi:MAG: ABC transporter substrate-binding protein/permease [Planctomycetota bacterium]